MIYFYKILVAVGVVLVRLGSFFDAKLHKAYFGRRRQEVASLAGSIWFHCASHGEYEMIAPVVKQVKRLSDLPIVITFFSPSGMEHSSAASIANYVYYKPWDRYNAVTDFVGHIKPRVVCFVKAEYWYNTIDVLHSKRIPFFFVSSIFRENRYPMGYGSSFFLNRIKKAEAIYTQDVLSSETLKRRGISNTKFLGNPRLDRIYERSLDAVEMDDIERFKGQSQLLVVGSSWPAEEKLVAQCSDYFLKKGIKILLAAHDVSEEHVARILELFKDSGVLWTDYVSTSAVVANDVTVLVMDRIGLLFDCYRYADYVLVGGGFGTKGIHNTLEPAVFGIPICFGPNNRGFPEVEELLDLGLYEEIQTSQDLIAFVENYRRSGTRDRVSEGLRNYFQRRGGAAAEIAQMLVSCIPDQR